jgi:hypothetical protein
MLFGEKTTDTWLRMDTRVTAADMLGDRMCGMLGSMEDHGIITFGQEVCPSTTSSSVITCTLT